MLTTLSAAFLVIVAFHSKAYSFARVRSRKSALAFRGIAKAFGAVVSLLPFQQRAIVTKEAKVLARDIGQAIQLLVLLALALLYLYNIRIFQF